MLKVLPVTIRGPKRAVKVHALLDEGSTVTPVDDALADSVGARGPVRGLRIHGANGMCTADAVARRVTLKICGNKSEYTMSAYTVRDLDLPRTTGIDTKIKPRILIGQDNAHCTRQDLIYLPLE